MKKKKKKMIKQWCTNELHLSQQEIEFGLRLFSGDAMILGEISGDVGKVRPDLPVPQHLDNVQNQLA